MKSRRLLCSLIWVCNLVILPATMYGQQCTSGITSWTTTTLAERVSVNDVFLATTVSVSGGDAAYATTHITQTNSFTSGTTTTSIGSPLTSTVIDGGSVATSLVLPISTYGYGGYTNDSQTSAIDECTGQRYPPFDGGIISGQTEAAVNVENPVAYFNGGGPGVIAVSQNYGPSWPGTATVESYTGFPANIALPQWSLSGPDAQNFKLSCTSCETTTIEAATATAVSCNTVLSVNYTIDGLSSNTLSLLVMSANANVPASSPTTGNPVDNTAVTTSNTVGYLSYQYWNVEDNCGDNLDDLNAFEAFPNGFTSLVSNDWPTPSATSWTIGNGGWIDQIGEWTSVDPPGLSPMPTSPQSPLNSEGVYQGTQQIWAGQVSSANATVDTLVKTQTQTHYIDHGLSQ